MPKVVFTSQLQRHIPSPTCDVEGVTVRAALDAVFAEHRALRGYVLDDQGSLRKHVVVFIDGTRVQDRERLSDAVRPDSEIHVLQALTGG
jgi:sulfur-carrier protein